MTTDFLFRYIADDAFFAAMDALGVPNNPSARPEEQLGNCSSPPQVTHQGVIRRVRLWPEQTALIAAGALATVPVLIDERSDEFDPDYVPEYTADMTDEDGNLYVGTVLPGRIGS